MNFERTGSVVASTSVTNAFLRSVYAWMGAGLALTGIIAVWAANSEYLWSLLYAKPWILWGCIIAELALVFILSLNIQKMSAMTATVMFIAYSALNGITLSVLLQVYTRQSVFQAFFACTGMFVAMSVYGLVTKKDLSSWGSLLFMGLVGIVIASIVNIFVGSTRLEWLISIVGVLIFLGLTAYDTQLLREMGNSVPQDDHQAVRKATIMGALKLYLDFINLFIMLLRLLGNRR